MEDDHMPGHESSQAPDVRKPHAKSETKRYSEIFREFDNLDLSLISSVGDDFLGDPDSQSISESITSESGDLALDHHDVSSEDAICPEIRSESSDAEGNPKAQEADLALCRCEDGVETALQYAKMWCRYAKDLLAWMEKRIGLEQEFAKNVMKTAEGAKATVAQQELMPLQYIYTMALEQDIKNSVSSKKTSEVLHNRCYQALAAKRNEIEKWRREFKEQWAKEQRRMNEALSAFKKSRQQYHQRCDELEKAKAFSAKALDDTAGIKTLDKRRKSKDEAHAKVMETELMFRQCVSDARIRQDELVKVKERIISHIRKLICQGDNVLKEATVNMFYYQRQQAEPVPLGYHNLELTCRSLEPGEPYLLYVLGKRRAEQPLQVFNFQEYVPLGKGNKRKTSNPLSSLQDSSPLTYESHSRRQSDGRRAGYSDSENFGGSMESLSSPVHINRRHPKNASTLTVSSDDLDERDMASELDYADGQAVKARTLSRAALTHRLRKMKSKMAKCKQCDNYIVVSGVECEECGVAFHRKCMEVCQLECEQRRGTVFGVDLCVLQRDRPGEVPFVVLRCTSEIEGRALSVQGVYRVSGSKPRIQKLCQAFETQKEHVDLSDLSPHDITSILKHFLKELPEPLLTFDLYGDFVDVGKTLQRLSEREPAPDTNEIMDVIHDLQQLLGRLPPHSHCTLQHLLCHLQRVSENYENNKMSPSNLGIVFGPTLLRPLVSTDMSMTALLDTTYQAVLVEFLITHHDGIFGPRPRPGTPPPPVPTAPLPETPPRAPCPLYADEYVEVECSSGERLHSLESRTIKRESSEGYISDKSSSNEAVDQLSPEANERAVVAVRAASGDRHGGPPGEPDPDPASKPHYRFTRQPVKYHRHHPAAPRLSNPGPAARQPESPARAGPGSADSSRSSSPEPAAPRISQSLRVNCELAVGLGSPVAAGGRGDHPPSPREVAQYMLGLEPLSSPVPGTASAPAQGSSSRAEAAARQADPHAESSMEGAGQSWPPPCHGRKALPDAQNLSAPAQKILSGLKLRRSHSGKDEQLFV